MRHIETEKNTTWPNYCKPYFHANISIAKPSWEGGWWVLSGTLSTPAATRTPDRQKKSSPPLSRAANRAIEARCHVRCQLSPCWPTFWAGIRREMSSCRLSCPSLPRSLSLPVWLSPGVHCRYCSQWKGRPRSNCELLGILSPFGTPALLFPHSSERTKREGRKEGTSEKSFHSPGDFTFPFFIACPNRVPPPRERPQRTTKWLLHLLP